MESIRILIADDYMGWRNQVRSLLRARPNWKVICDVANGSEAVEMAEELKPDVILLEIGLQYLNGIEAAWRIRHLSPHCKIVFLSADNSLDVIRVAMSTGARGFVYKPRAQNDLLSAMDAVLQGKRFVSGMIKGYKFADLPQKKAPHEALFYSDDEVFLSSLTRFIAGALEAGDVAVSITTEPHRHSLLHRLRARRLDMDTAIREGRYIALDAVKTLSAFMINDVLDAPRFFEIATDLIRTAAKAGKNDHPRVAVCGECGNLLCASGRASGAVRLEQLWEQLGTTYEIYSLCGYLLNNFNHDEDHLVFGSICTVHSAVHSQEI